MIGEDITFWHAPGFKGPGFPSLRLVMTGVVVVVVSLEFGP